jgi:hypothetical protein
MDHKSAFGDYSLVRSLKRRIEIPANYTIAIVFRVDSSLSAEQEEILASSKEVKTVYTNIFQRYPFVTIGIKRSSLKPSADFMKAITHALAEPPERKQKALNAVFGTYGHAFQMEFDLGASMMKTSTATTSVEVRVLLNGSLEWLC